MGLKIYHGFAFNTAHLRMVFHHLTAMRPMVKEMALHAQARFLAKVTAYDVDHKLLRGETPDNPLGAAYNEMRDRQRAATREGRRDPAVDFSFAVSILPISDMILGIPRTEQREFRDFLEAHPWWVDFGFWANERPDDVSKQAWEHRREKWTEALGPDYVPAEHGFTFEFVEPYAAPKREVIANLLPSFAGRVQKHALTRTTNARSRATWPWDEGYVPQAGEIFAHHSASEAWVTGTAEGQAALRAELAHVASVIPASLTGYILEGGGQ